MTSKKRKLKLVPYEPDNYTPGEVLAFDDATVLKSDKAIGAALSLYFQWEKKRSCHVTFTVAPDAKALPCELDYDHDEASPTEIRIQLLKSLGKRGFKVVPGSSILIRFEIFRVTYVFTSTVTAVSADPKVEGWHSIIEVPNELRVLKTRNLPRLILDDDHRKKLPKASWSTSKGVVLDFELLEIGMGSIRASFSGDAVSEKTGTLSFGDVAVPTVVARSLPGEIILKLAFKDHQDFGGFWDYYRLVAYPSMKSRYEVPYEEGIELYKKTGYFEVFDDEKDPLHEQNIMNTWEGIRGGFHNTNTDYYVTDSKSRPVGSSSLALLYYSADAPIWMFHQLCAMKRPNLVEQSGILYAWRAEYLSGRKENLEAVGSFRSKSRWLERIYVKHVNNSKHGSKLVPTKNRHCIFEQNTSGKEVQLKKYPMGALPRITTNSKNIWAAANPKYLNAGAALDLIIATFEMVPWSKIQEIAGQIAKALNFDTLSFLVTLPIDYEMAVVGGIDQASDRFFQIPKHDLLNLISSVEHSVAVTERKLIYGSDQ